ncbi:lovastatin nonaketide synthase [Whalleya microplaca]|nr:lovastatin nonaketide synthase [Whalleya microplaca]
MPFLDAPVESTSKGPELEPIAICGMSCRLPGGVDSPSALWDMLLQKRVGNSQKVPQSRFNIDAFFHANEDRPGSFRIPGGYYLDGRAENFDPTFFNMTPVEAMWLDPQQRKILEVCYEAIESAGLNLDKISGSNTGVFCASFTADYQQMTFKDHDFRHNYAATGVDVGIISARIGNTFNFYGPSALINTACSSSVYAIHNACHALRAKDCDAALVGGVNIIMTPDQHMNTANLAIMSPTNMCHTFDASADGYGRAEGAGALYLKRLDDAVRDGDVIRSVIRSSSCNSNGKVPGYGITFPNVDGQEKVIRQAYKRAGLDPNDTAYFETHGTGTPVGDPIEVRAVSRAMNDTRSRDNPLIIGAIKPNIGHSEAASGIFAIIKASLMVEKGYIPGVAGLTVLNPNIHEKEWNVQVQRDGDAWPVGFLSRRASVSSFGYGGTNAHVIIENVEALVPGYKHGATKEKTTETLNETTTRPFLLTMSAHDKTTLTRNIDAHREVASKFNMHDLVHTLANKRSDMATKGFALVSEGQVASDMSVTNFKLSSNTNLVSDLVFIFTGQGAAWASMGKHAIEAFPVFRESIKRLDGVLRGLEHPPSFSLEQQLSCSAEESRISEPDIAQSTLSAIQIAIVDLLASWGVTPKATIGHSAGEIAASYAAGLISAPEAIIASYYRGYSIAKYGPRGGSMLAVGKGIDELSDYQEVMNLRLTVACENSPKSVTLSGPAEDIQAARDTLAKANIFARELNTGMAYHSSAMEPVATPMAQLITDAVAKIYSLGGRERYPVRPMMSSVYNRVLSREDITGSYWASNLVNPVKFATGVSLLFNQDVFGVFNGFVEVGPHSALAGPFKQICLANKVESSIYIPTIVRPEGNAFNSLLKTAGELYIVGYPVNLNSVNGFRPVEGSGSASRHYQSPRTLVDLPPYQWNYEKVYWTEPRASAEYRQLTHARHDLLGRRILGLSDNSIAWRNVLRLTDIPWLEDHKLGGSIMFPAAGHLALATEAVRQHCEINGIDCVGVTLRDVELKTALVTPKTDTGIEIQFRLTIQPNSLSPESFPTYAFAVESVGDDNTWTIHSTGTCFARGNNFIPPTVDHPVNMDDLTQRHSGQKWKESFARVGLEYERQFAGLNAIRTHGKYDYQAAGKIPIATRSDLMQDESRCFLHPATVDSLLQLIIIAINAGLYNEMPWGVIPVRFDEITICNPTVSHGSVGDGVAWLPEGRTEQSRHFVSNGKLWTADGNVVLDIKGLHTLAYEAALPPKSENALDPMPYASVVWKPDSALVELAKAFPHSEMMHANDAIVTLVGIAYHKHPISLLIIDSAEEFPLEEILKTQLATTISVSTSLPETASAKDLVLLSQTCAEPLVNSGSIISLKPLLGEKGQALLLMGLQSVHQAQEQLTAGGLRSFAIQFTDKVMIWVAPLTTEPPATLDGPTRTFDVVYASGTSSPEDLVEGLTRCQISVQTWTLAAYVAAGASPNQLILFDPDGDLLFNATTETLEAVKYLMASNTPIMWLTSDVNQGKNPTASMVASFLRVAREENQSARISVLDYDKAESHDSVAGAIAAITNASTAASSMPVETEYWLHHGILHISRVSPNVKLNERMLPDKAKLSSETLLPGKRLHGVIDGPNVIYQQTDDVEQKSIGANELEVQVDTVEFRRQDLQGPPSSPRLVSGQVIGVGDSIKGDFKGKTVVSYTTSPYDTITTISNDGAVEIAPGSAKALLQRLPIFVEVINALLAIENIEQKAVLLVSSSIDMNAAMVSLSRSLGFALAIARKGSTEIVDKVMYLNLSDLTGIQNVLKDAGSHAVIITDHFTSLCEDLWKNIPSGANFVLTETDRAGFSNVLDITPFSRDASFTATSISSNLKSHPILVKKALALAIRELPDGQATESAVITLDTFSKDTIIPATAVLSLRYGVDTITVAASEFSIRFSPNDVYLLVGCLGGLGRSLTNWMMDHGAKHFAFISRSGEDKKEAARLIKDITAAGAVTRVFRGDAAKVSIVQGVVDTITKEEGKKIKGVVHAAMVLNDTMLQNMTLDKWHGTLSPKVSGAMALHEALKGHDQDLDFFVMTSSISATVPQPGQSNYAAANAFLDSLAWSRNLEGKPAVSLSLPMILGVGVVAESDNLESLLTRRGLYGDNEREMLRGFAAAMSQPKPEPGSATQADAAIIMGLEPTRIGSSLRAAAESSSLATSWIEDARFVGLRELAQTAAWKSGEASKAGSFSDKLLAAATGLDGYKAALQLTTQHIMEKCGAILMISPDSIDFDGKSPGAYGLDSMIGVELRNWLFKELRLKIAFTDLLSTSMTFKTLSELVLEANDITA